MKPDYIYSAIAFIILIIIQITILPIIALHGIVPNLVVILLVYFSVKNGKLFGSITGFCYGFFSDIIMGSIIGSGMFALTLSGFIAGLFQNENKTAVNLGSFVFLLIVLLTSFIAESIMHFLVSYQPTNDFWDIFLSKTIFSAMYTSFLSIAVIVFYPKKAYTE